MCLSVWFVLLLGYLLLVCCDLVVLCVRVAISCVCRVACVGVCVCCVCVSLFVFMCLCWGCYYDGVVVV